MARKRNTGVSKYGKGPKTSPTPKPNPGRKQPATPKRAGGESTTKGPAGGQTYVSDRAATSGTAGYRAYDMEMERTGSRRKAADAQHDVAAAARKVKDNRFEATIKRLDATIAKAKKPKK